MVAQYDPGPLSALNSSVLCAKLAMPATCGTEVTSAADGLVRRTELADGRVLGARSAERVRAGGGAVVARDGVADDVSLHRVVERQAAAVVGARVVDDQVVEDVDLVPLASDRPGSPRRRAVDLARADAAAVVARLVALDEVLVDDHRARAQRERRRPARLSPPMWMPPPSSNDSLETMRLCWIRPPRSGRSGRCRRRSACEKLPQMRLSVIR